MDNFYYIFCHQHISDIKGGTSVLRILPNKCTAVNYICKKASSEIFDKVLNSPPDTVVVVHITQKLSLGGVLYRKYF